MIIASLKSSIRHLLHRKYYSYYSNVCKQVFHPPEILSMGGIPWRKTPITEMQSKRTFQILKLGGFSEQWTESVFR